jgi:hypothetical protein
MRDEMKADEQSDAASRTQPADAEFRNGLDLARDFYADVVADLVAAPHSACLLGEGSEVLGYDNARSTDHEWGPRVQILVASDQIEAVNRRIDAGLPSEFEGFPTRWHSLAAGTVTHHIEVASFDDWIVRQLGIDPRDGMDAAAWLGMSQQRLLQITEGRVFRDDDGALARVRALLAWWPNDVWLWLMASGWHLIGNAQPLLGRVIEAGDVLGARLLVGRLCRMAMEMAFLHERRYWPYDKWYGTAFRRLLAAPELAPMLTAALTSVSPDEQQAVISNALIALGHAHNALGLTPAVEPVIDAFQVNINDAVRPYQVLNAGDFAAACRDAIADEPLRKLAPVGGFDQLTHADDALVNFTSWPQRLTANYRELLRQDSDNG